jgi:hypothetical protein
VSTINFYQMQASTPTSGTAQSTKTQTPMTTKRFDAVRNCCSSSLQKL